MPTSFFFKDNKAKSEGVLLQSLVDEAIKIHGIDVYYLPARRPNLDQLYLQDPEVFYDTSYCVAVYLDNYEGFSGMQSMAKFGIVIYDQLQFTISVREFETQILSHEPQFLRPREGDLIYFPYNNKCFLIKYVAKHDLNFYTHGTLASYACKTELYEYGDEKFTVELNQSLGLNLGPEFIMSLSLDILDYSVMDETGAFITDELSNYITTEKYDINRIDPLEDTLIVKKQNSVNRASINVDPFSSNSLNWTIPNPASPPDDYGWNDS